MAELKKFLFDNFIVGGCDTKLPEPLPDIVPEEPAEVEEPEVFTEQPEPEPEPVEPSFSQEEVDAKTAAAEREGYERGLQSARNEIAAEANVLLNDISQKLTVLLAQSEAREKEREKEAVQTVRQALMTLVPTLLEENAAVLVDKFLQDNFNNFKHNEKLSFYINPDIISYVQDSIVKLANSNDFEGKISIHKDGGLERCACRVEWDNGGVEYAPGEQLSQIGQMLDRQ